MRYNGSRTRRAYESQWAPGKKWHVMTTHKVEIGYPDEALEGGLDEAQIKALAREALYVRLYEQGLLSSGRAAELLGMTRWAFLDLLDRYGVSSFDENIDFDEKLRRARP